MDHEPSLDDMDFGSVSPAMEDAGGSASRTSDEFNDTGLPPIDMNDGLPEEFNEKPAVPDVSESASASLDLPDFGETKAEETEANRKDRSTWLSALFVAGGLAGLVLGSNLFVDAGLSFLMNKLQVS